ncbi:hypothetical protein ACSNOK_23525 [Streptomyces sp. URMC 126]|uniref:hypothetical protein n=1 Tax=Streptomyces sp. URMC 126 TaxID=3423401 RepID=UPI003F195E5B
MIRALDCGPCPGYDELPLTDWEVRAMFPRTYDFGYWVVGGDHPTVSEGIREGVEREHPGGCLEELPGLVAEIQKALLLFPGEKALAEGLGPGIPWAGVGVFEEIVHRARGHVADHH